ncbi:MAG: hypothetical protein OEY56_07405 [Cyclobacteriaceae bacterium]|nr:hypothetical protein [Cyclobacteriaceae bacterium]
MTKISIEWGGFVLLEPMSFILNWVMMLQSFFYFHKLKEWRNSSFSINWRWFFLLFGLSAFFGGPSHLFYHYTGLFGKIPGWSSAVLAVSFMELAMVSLTNHEYLKSRLEKLVYLKLFITIASLTYNFHFDVVLFHTIGMAVFIFVPGFIFLFQRRNELNYLVLGVFSLLLALPFRLYEVDFHTWFNRDDIGHVMMMTALYLFFRGVREYESNALSVPQVSKG